MSERVPAEIMPPVFSEEAFYLREFRGRSIGFVVQDCDPASAPLLATVFAKLRANDTRVVCFSDTPLFFEAFENVAILEPGTPRIEVEVWRKLQEAAFVGLLIASEGGGLSEIALRMGLSKLVWIDSGGGIQDADGSDLSFVDLSGLRVLRRDLLDLRPRLSLALPEFEAFLNAGGQSISLCSPEALRDELFTFSGSGTLFSKGKYVSVRALRLDDFDAAAAFVERGVEEGFLLPRSAEGADALLASGFGAFVEDRFLAGIASLRIDAATHSGEIAGLYTLTRFMGGVGKHLVSHALDCARTHGLEFIYACTTSPEAGCFFERQGFVRAGAETLPRAKWEGYSEARREKLLCFRCELNSNERSSAEAKGGPGA